MFSSIVEIKSPKMKLLTCQISEMCCEAVKSLFKQDKLGFASLGVVKVMSGLLKSRNHNVRPEVRFCVWKS